MKKSSLIVSVIFFLLVVMVSACTKKEFSQREKEKIASIESQLKVAPAGSFFKTCEGPWNVIQNNIKEGNSIWFKPWGGDITNMSAKILAENWKVQDVITPDHPIPWGKVARIYLPHDEK